MRSDPVFKLIAEQSPDGDDLASQPTISRLENSVTAGDLLKMEDWFIERFVESFTEVPAEITLDIDTFDDPAHGNQHGELVPCDDALIELAVGQSSEACCGLAIGLRLARALQCPNLPLARRKSEWGKEGVPR